MPQLRTSVYVAAPIPWSKPDGTQGGVWSPISCTLIYGERDAVLVDTPITRRQTEELATWIEHVLQGRKLTTIYITHGHGDHFFGIAILRKLFPHARAVATQAVIERSKQQIEPGYFKSTWGTQFPGQIDETFELPEPLDSSNKIYLEGHLLEAIEVGQADTHDSTVLWAPSIKLAVCGDVVYGEVHQMLAEANTPEKRAGWIASIDKVQALGPEIVVAGHKKAHEVDGSFHLENTKEYILTFEDALKYTKNSRELFSVMEEKYPRRFNTGALVMGCIAAFKTGSRI